MPCLADQAMEALEEKNAEIEQLRQQVNGLFQELANKREERALDFQKFNIEQQNKVALDTAKLNLESEKAGLDNQVDQGKLEIERQKVAMDAQDKLDETIESNDRMMGEIYGTIR